jgi:hypothetical protein
MICFSGKEMAHDVDKEHQKDEDLGKIIHISDLAHSERISVIK